MEPQPAKIRVLVIDDSVVSRRMVARVVDATEDLTVEATAANGRIGLAKLGLRAFDAVILDVEMPEMDGLETLSEIRKRHEDLPVIMFSSLTRAGAETTLDALALGANDYVTKPTASSTADAEAHIADELITRIRALCAARAEARREVASRASSRNARASATIGMEDAACARADALESRVAAAQPPSAVAAPVHAIGIGGSTGGPNVLGAILRALPRVPSVPIFVVQHMPPIFTHLLAERLDAASSLTVVEAEDGMLVRPGWAYVAPGDFHMTVGSEGPREVISLSQGPRENSCRPAVDVLFRSLAATYGRHVLAAVLTGMGRDGLEGARNLVETGARVVVQDESSSVVWGMPGYVARAGLATLVGHPQTLADEIIACTARPRDPPKASRATQ